MTLQEYLNKNFITPMEFALQSGVCYRTIYRILSGERRTVRMENRRKIFKATNGEVNLNNYLDN